MPGGIRCIVGSVVGLGWGWGYCWVAEGSVEVEEAVEVVEDSVGVEDGGNKDNDGAFNLLSLSCKSPAVDMFFLFNMSSTVVAGLTMFATAQSLSNNWSLVIMSGTSIELVLHRFQSMDLEKGV